MNGAVRLNQSILNEMESNFHRIRCGTGLFIRQLSTANHIKTKISRGSGERFCRKTKNAQMRYLKLHGMPDCQQTLVNDALMNEK
jgi:hypothetical protein